jgi:hypothetical protein
MPGIRLFTGQSRIAIDDAITAYQPGNNPQNGRICYLKWDPGHE